MVSKQSVLTALVPKKSVALPVGGINVGQRAVENTSVKDKSNNLMHRIHENTNDEVRFCEQIESNKLSSSRKQVQTSPVVYNTERRTEDMNNLDKGTLSRGSKGSDKAASNDKSDFDNLYNVTTSLGSKGADRVVSDKSILRVENILRRPYGPRGKVKGI